VLAILLKRLLPRRFGFGRTRFAEVYALYERGELARAERECAAIADAPRADVDFLDGLIACRRGDLVRAAVSMRKALDARPNEPTFRLGLGRALHDLGRHADALEHFETMLARTDLDGGTRASALREAGRCHAAQGDGATACRYFGDALALAPADPALSNLLSTALYRESRTDDARAAIEPLVRSGAAGLRIRRALLMPPVYDSQSHIDEVRMRLERELDAAIAAPGPPVEDPGVQIAITAFYLAYHNRNNAALLAKVCEAHRRVYDPPAPLERVRRKRGRRIRVGFVSTFFYSHSVGRTTHGLIRDLPRERFSVHVFAVNPREDPMRARIEASADEYVRLPAELAVVRRAIADASLDVLVFADIGMGPLTYALALSRLAPIQATTWGHSDTSGVDTVDYYLSAGGVESEHAQAHYTEKLVRPAAFFLPAYGRPILERRMSREELGLPADRRLYACLQPAFKLHPDMDGILAALLERDAAGIILLLESNASAAALLRHRFARTLGAHASRVRFVPAMAHQKYLALLAAVDVVLDPLYFGGCNTSCEAMAVATPLVTLPGNHLYGRFTLGLYREMGLTQCVASTPAEYVDTALRIAGEPERRIAISREIAARSDVVYERADIALAYADFLEEAVESRD
jgi:predicted O-linked N-acetylglucosamine transferase (SPINDLY family)